MEVYFKQCPYATHRKNTDWRMADTIQQDIPYICIMFQKHMFNSCCEYFDGKTIEEKEPENQLTFCRKRGV